MAVNAGIKEVYIDLPSADITDVGSATLVGLGFRQNGQLIGEPFNVITDNRNREFPNLFNFKAEFNSMQISSTFMQKLIQCSKAGGVATAILTTGIVKQTGTPDKIAPGTGNIFIFDAINNRSLGFDWELKLTPTERIISVTMERAFSPSEATAILDDSETNSINFAENKVPMLNTRRVSSGFIIPSFVDGRDNSVVNIPAIQLADFSISLATESNKNAFNVSLIKGVKMEFEATMSQADATIFADWSVVNFPEVDVRVTLDSTNYIEIKQLSFSRSGRFEVGDENRNAVIKLSGMLDLDYSTISGNNIIFNTYLT